MSKTSKIIIFSFAGLCLAGGIGLLSFLNVRQEIPEKVKESIDVNYVSLYTETKSEGNGFMFKFEGEEKTIEVYSEISNLIYNDDLKEKGVELGKKYDVSVKLLGDVSGGDSLFSKKLDKWLAKEYLDQPEIEYKNDTQTVSWDPIENAYNYTLFYFQDGKKTEVTQNKTEFCFDKVEGGYKNFYVVANSNKDYYLNSQPSNMCSGILTQYVYSELKEEDISIDKTKTLTITSKEDFDRIKVVLSSNNQLIFSNSCSEEVYRFDIQKVDGKNEIKYKLNCLYESYKSKYTGNPKYLGITILGDNFNKESDTLWIKLQ